MCSLYLSRENRYEQIKSWGSSSIVLHNVFWYFYFSDYGGTFAGSDSGDDSLNNGDRGALAVVLVAGLLYGAGCGDSIGSPGLFVFCKVEMILVPMNPPQINNSNLLVVVLLHLASLAVAYHVSAGTWSYVRTQITQYICLSASAPGS